MRRRIIKGNIIWNINNYNFNYYKNNPHLKTFFVFNIIRFKQTQIILDNKMIYIFL